MEVHVLPFSPAQSQPRGAPEQPVGVSVVVPIKDERDSVAEMAERLTRCLRAAAPHRGFEVVFVDDGSEDGSWTQVLEAGAAYDEVLGVRHRRNFGKAAALASGLEVARGETIVTMDGDLQDDPEEVPRMLAALEDADVVSGWKVDRQDPLGKTLPSRLFNAVVRRLSHVQLRDFNCGFKAYTRPAALAMRPYLYGELHRYLPVLLAAHGFRTVELGVRHHPRLHGRSKYGVSRMVKGAFDLCTVLLLTRFRYRPLHAFGAVAVLVAAVTVTAAVAAGAATDGVAREIAVVGGVALAMLVVTGCLAELVVHGIGPQLMDWQVSEMASNGHLPLATVREVPPPATGTPPASDRIAAGTGR